MPGRRLRVWPALACAVDDSLQASARGNLRGIEGDAAAAAVVAGGQGKWTRQSATTLGAAPGMNSTMARSVSQRRGPVGPCGRLQVALGVDLLGSVGADGEVPEGAGLKRAGRESVHVDGDGEPGDLIELGWRCRR